MTPDILVLNTALGGKRGNTNALLDRACTTFSAKKATVKTVTLDARTRYAQVEPALRRANALLIGTGTYWDSWSHLLQRFLEEATASEGTPTWLGKPAGVIVTMHSVGEKASSPVFREC